MHIFVSDTRLNCLIDKRIREGRAVEIAKEIAAEQWDDEVFRERHNARLEQARQIEAACIHDYKVLHEQGDDAVGQDCGSAGFHVTHRPYSRDYFCCAKCGKTKRAG